MVKDNPSDDIFNYFYKIIFRNHPLSLSILGTVKSLKTLYAPNIRDYFNKNFHLNGVVLSAAGNIDHKDLVNRVRENIEGYTNGNTRKARIASDTFYKIANKRYDSKTEASHICYGGPGCSRDSTDRYPLSLFTNILGGSMSSRLFQKIREDKGLSYTIFASNSQYADAGVIIIYAATSPSSVNKVMDLIKKEIKSIKKDGIKQEELDIARENTKGNIVLGVEDISSRMFRLGKALLMDGKVLTIDDILRKIDNVTITQVNDAVNKYFDIEKMSTIVIGKKQTRRPK